MKYIFFALLFFQLSVSAQQKDSLPDLVADRPDQTETPMIVPKKHFQVETGFLIEKVNSIERAYSHPSILWKYGVNGKAELRLITEINSSNSVNAGLVPVLIGFKQRLAEEKGAMPMISFIGHLSLPFASSKKFETSRYAPEFRFTLQHTLSEKISLGYNLGMEWNGEDSNPDYIYTLTTGYSLTSKAGFFVELYGYLNKLNAADHRFDAGFTYLLSRNFMLDVSGGFGITRLSPKHFLSMGFSFRLPD